MLKATFIPSKHTITIALWSMWSIVCLLLISLFSILIFKSYRQLGVLELKNVHHHAHIEALKEKINYEENYLKAMTHNPEFLERIAREKLGYVKEQELLFIF